MYKDNWTQPWPMGSEIYHEVHENPKAFFNNSSLILLEPLAHGSNDWSLPREDCIITCLDKKCIVRKKVNLYRSVLTCKLWPFIFSIIHASFIVHYIYNLTRWILTFSNQYRKKELPPHSLLCIFLIMVVQGTSVVKLREPCIKLYSNNFLLRNAQVEVGLINHRLGYFIEKDPLILVEYTSESDCSCARTMKEYKWWFLQDQEIFSWLVPSLFEVTLLQKRHSKTVLMYIQRRLWNRLWSQRRWKC